jgi:hypothetical protein
VGTSVVDFPRVGVLGWGRLVSEREIKGAGAASEGRTGVDVWRFRGGVGWFVGVGPGICDEGGDYVGCGGAGEIGGCAWVVWCECDVWGGRPCVFVVVLVAGLEGEGRG